MTTNAQHRYAAELAKLRAENDRLRMWILAVTGAQTDDGPALVIPEGTVSIPMDALLESYSITAMHHQIRGATLMRDEIAKAYPKQAWPDPFTVCASASARQVSK